MKCCHSAILPSVGLKSRSAVGLLYHSAHPECCYQFKIFTSISLLSQKSWLLTRIFPTTVLLPVYSYDNFHKMQWFIRLNIQSLIHEGFEVFASCSRQWVDAVGYSLFLHLKVNFWLILYKLFLKKCNYSYFRGSEILLQLKLTAFVLNSCVFLYLRKQNKELTNCICCTLWV